MTIDTTHTITVPPPTIGRTRHLLTPLPEPGEFLFVIDNSAAERFPCPTLAANYLVEGREPHPTNAALIFGGALHVGIETLLRGPRRIRDINDALNENVWETPTDLLIRAGTDLAAFFTKHPAPLDEYRTLSNALEVLRYYQQRCTFPDYNMTILSDDKGPLIERAFELPLGVLEVNATIPMPWLTETQHIQTREAWLSLGAKCHWHDGTHKVTKIHVAWAGRIDVIAKCNGAVRVVDHKTTSQADGKKRVDFINDFQISSQTRGYLWAAQQLWPEFNVTGFCLDAIQFKKPANGKTVMEMGPKGGQPALDFFRSYFDYSSTSLASWAENSLVRVEDFIHSLVRGFFPMETTYCFNRKYGKCPYHEVCCIATDNPEAAKQLLHSEAFRPVTWNPTADR